MALQGPASKLYFDTTSGKETEDEVITRLLHCLFVYCCVDLWLNSLQLHDFYMLIYCSTHSYIYTTILLANISSMWSKSTDCPERNLVGSSFCDSLLVISVTNPCVYSLLWLIVYRRNLLTFTQNSIPLFKESSTAWKICCYGGTVAQDFPLFLSSESHVWSCLCLPLQNT